MKGIDVLMKKDCAYKGKGFVLVACLLSIIIVCTIFWQFKLTGITKTLDATCEKEEHIHNENCFEKVLVCEEDDSEHKHGKECYKEENVCGKEEHSHTLMCYADSNADVETRKQWEKSLGSPMMKDSAGDVAETQIGYEESKRNYILSEEDNRAMHYTRYGEWYGKAYEKWNCIFACFCLHYSGTSSDKFPYRDQANHWVSKLKETGQFAELGDYNSKKGDLLFVSSDDSKYKMRVGVITKATDEKIEVIEGDADGTVSCVIYDINDTKLVGYGKVNSSDEVVDSQELDSKDSRKKALSKKKNESSTTNAIRTMNASGNDYEVSVKLTKKADIPDNAELVVDEIEANSPEYDNYYTQTIKVMDMEDEPSFCRFFSISFMYEGNEIEPKDSVEVSILYKNPPLQLTDATSCTAVHFAEKGVELIETETDKKDTGEIVRFTQDSFSVVGTVAEAKIELTAGQQYIFYTGDNQALGVVNGRNGYTVTKVPVNVTNNGYIIPESNTTDINTIIWTYQNGGLYNAAANRYLDAVYTTPQVVSGMDRYTSTLGLSTTVKNLSSSVITNGVRLVQNYNQRAGTKRYMVAYEKGAFVSGTEFDNAQTYLLTAIVKNVSSDQVEPGALSIVDDIRDSGCIKPKLNVSISGDNKEYIWEKSEDNGETWTTVVRSQVGKDLYNIAEDGSWLNIALDQGSEAMYRVSLIGVDGEVLEEPIVSADYYVRYYDKLKNGNFENPAIPTDSTNSNYQPFLPNGTLGMIWKTTASDGQIEYITVGNSNFQQLSERWHLCESASDGEQFVELNATSNGALYQDVLTIPGTTMYWNLSHRGRGTSYKSGQKDTMYVVIISTKLAEQYNITTQAAVNDVIKNPSKYPGAAVETITSDNISWHKYSGEYTVPDEQYLSRYFFVSGPTASNDVTVGNHLDGVSFSIELPPPEATKTNIQVKKIIKGLTYDEAETLMEKITFSIRNTSAKNATPLPGASFGKLIMNSDGSYTATANLMNQTPGRYEITESIISTSADMTGYDRKTSLKTNYGYGNIISSSTLYGQVINANKGENADITFTNEYEKAKASIRIVKKGSDNAYLNAGFELSQKSGNNWSEVAKVNTENGSAEINNLSYEEIYKLRETRVPDGYVGLHNAVYFKIKPTGIEICDESGKTITVSDGLISTSENKITIVNNQSFVLPETGGSGTKLSEVIGSLLILCGMLILLHMRFKRNANVS